jgi:DNA-binding transcriptional LysR family regulator
VGKQISLTESGNALYQASRDILDTLGRFEMQVNDQKGLKTGQLRIAVVTTAKYFAPRLLGKFCQLYPGINVSLEVANREQILERLNRNLDDLYIIGKPPVSTDLKFQPYLANPMVVVAPASHPFTQRKSIPLADLADENFIIRERGSGTRVAVENLFAEEDQKIKIRMELGSNEAIKQGISAGLGISVLSLHTIVRGDLEELAILDVDGFPISWQWYVGHPKGKRLSVVAKTFIDFMYEQGPSMLPKNIV